MCFHVFRIWCNHFKCVNFTAFRLPVNDTFFFPIARLVIRLYVYLRRDNRLHVSDLSPLSVSRDSLGQALSPRHQFSQAHAPNNNTCLYYGCTFSSLTPHLLTFFDLYTAVHYMNNVCISLHLNGPFSNL